MNRYWIYVIFAGLLEVVWVSGLKYSDSPLEWIGTGAIIVISFVAIIVSSSKLPVGTVYAVFTGLGTGGSVIVEILLFHEPFKLSKIILVAILLAGVIGLKFVTGDNPKKEAA
ncbi:DMT family transporter [Paenibacillus sepulcri]|uniref:Multidrug efflux SMR transporter n=1 Tax=Paenibacillus sepulcri TaxID=359917 RepID=A0ABS7CAS7_9BACL|nr:multidrug efflux SMR transporter [Paenibacillus sepulcri]